MYVIMCVYKLQGLVFIIFYVYGFLWVSFKFLLRNFLFYVKCHSV
jgi:hypothetical protein